MFEPNYHMVTRPAGWDNAAILQHEPNGPLLFQHCVQNKPTLDGYRMKHLVHQHLCERHLAELKALWHGRLWDNRTPNGAEKAVLRALAGQRFRYRRAPVPTLNFSGGERELEFTPTGHIGAGAAACERRYTVHEIGGVVQLTLCGDEQPTAHYTAGADGVWRGRWLIGERCESELSPLAGISIWDQIAELLGRYGHKIDASDVRQRFANLEAAP